MKIQIERIKIRSSGFSSEQINDVASNLSINLSKEFAGRRIHFAGDKRIVIPSLVLKSMSRENNESASDFGSRLAGRIFSAVMDQKSENKGKEKT